MRRQLALLLALLCLPGCGVLSDPALLRHLPTLTKVVAPEIQKLISKADQENIFCFLKTPDDVEVSAPDGMTIAAAVECVVLVTE